MKFSAATIVACAAIANAVAVPASIKGGSDGTGIVGDTPASTAANKVIASSVESHFSGIYDTATGYLVAKEDNETSQALQKRAAVVALIGIVAVKGTVILTKIAIEIGAETIKNLGQWNKVRETFTQKTTLEMWNRNPDYTKYPAVACYNKGYHLKDANGHTGRVSAKLSLGQLNTDYDCMYMTGNNAFYTWSDGGYINLSYRYNSNRCSFDQKTGDLTCN